MVTLSKHPGKGWCLELFSEEKEQIVKFVSLCRGQLSHLNAFHQSGYLPDGKLASFQMFEFWTINEGAILESCIEVAAEMGMELDLK